MGFVLRFLSVRQLLGGSEPGAMLVIITVSVFTAASENLLLGGSMLGLHARSRAQGVLSLRVTEFAGEASSEGLRHDQAY